MHYVIQNAKTLSLICCLNFGISMYRKIQEFIVYLLLGLLLSIVVSSSFGQQNQNTLQQEVEALKNRVSELEGKLQTVENVEKMELAAKLAEAEAKLNNTDIDKLKGELRESNNDWLRAWSGWFLTIIGIFAAILLGVSYVFWFWLKSKTDKLIANEVEKSLNGFREDVKKVEILTEELSILQKHYVVSVIENYLHFSVDQSYYSEKLNILPEQALIDVFCDENNLLVVRHKAAEVLANRKSAQFVFPAVEFLNLVIDYDLFQGADLETQDHLRDIVNFIGQIQTREAYEGLKNFLNCLLTENPEHKELFLPCTVFLLAQVSLEMDLRDPVDMLKEVIPDLKEIREYEIELITLAEYFDNFEEPEGISQIMTHHADKLPELKEKCLELLEKYKS